VRFEWDDSKAERNLRKHGIRFSEAVGVFLDPQAVEFVDEEHSSDTERQSGVIRILHARRADRRMVSIYEGKQE